MHSVGNYVYECLKSGFSPLDVQGIVSWKTFVRTCGRRRLQANSGWGEILMQHACSTVAWRWTCTRPILGFF